MGRRLFQAPVRHRLAFRELGLSIGLHALDRLLDVMAANPGAFIREQSPRKRLDDLMAYKSLTDEIEAFWLEPANRNTPTYVEHGDINTVMLSTSLVPDGFLKVQNA